MGWHASGILEDEEEDEGGGGRLERKGELVLKVNLGKQTSPPWTWLPPQNLPLLTSAEDVKAGIKQRICGREQLDEGGNQNPLCWGYSLAAGMGPILWVCPLPQTVTLG